MNKAVFLDKDGTLVKDVPYNVDPALISLEPYTVHALRFLQEQGYQLLMVSNQPGIALGYFSEADVHVAFLHISKLLKKQGVGLHGFYYCPHDPQGRQWPYAVTCSCRKPLPGMLLQAAAEHSIDLSASWMIGDILHDVETGNQAGCRTVLLDNGHETEWDLRGKRNPTYIAHNLLEAAEIIVKRTKNNERVEQL
jgi:D,D-heptose 1,7-bisphosphate phosphatase